MKYFVIFFAHFLILFQPVKSQNLIYELNNIALSNDMMGGAVVVFCERQIVDTFYVGKADYERNIHVNEHTRFRIASISKTITTIAIMQLAEQHLLDLNADISTLLGFNVQNPNYPNDSITVEMLLSHTSTIIDGPTYNSFLQATVNNNPIPNLSEILTPSGSFYSAGQFNNKIPGTYFNYSNFNYVILGTIVEKISNLRFDVFCRQNIFQPLGLDASFNVNDLQDINEVAVLYRKTSGVWVPQAENYQGIQPVFTNLTGYVPGTNGGRFGPQGGLRCSAQDLAKIFMCIFNPNLCPSPVLSTQSVSDMIANHWTYSGNNGNNYYGLFLSWGLGIHRITSTPGNDMVLSGSAAMFGHAGEAYGLVSDVYYDTTRKAGFVFITNGVGVGYQTNSNSAFYTVEQEIFNAIENYGNLHNCLSLGLDWKLNEYSEIQIYPNPAKNYINIITQFKINKILIYNLLGQQFNCTIDNNRIDVSNLSKGTHLIEITDQFGKIYTSIFYKE